MYFARLKESLGISKETIALPANTENIQDLIIWQASRGEVWSDEFNPENRLRAAINHTLVNELAKIKSGDEAAFFPPVTGG